jgi:glucosyl-3-phosphoglycerate phosphatase
MDQPTTGDVLPSSVTRLVLVRHGETDWNVDGRWQGQGGEGLSARGHAQSEATARHLARAYPDTVLVARSDSQRVEETARPLTDLLDAPVIVDPRLREIDVGRWSGRTRAEVQATDPEGWAAYRRGDDVAIGGGETVSQLRRRAVAALIDVAARAGRGPAIVITHGWTLRVAVSALLGKASESAADLARAANCSVTVVDVGRDAAELLAYAVCDHLDHALVSPTTAAVRPA